MGGSGAPLKAGSYATLVSCIIVATVLNASKSRTTRAGTSKLLRRTVPALLAITLLSLLTLRNLGNWLAIDEPLAKSQAIVVLGGQVPFRAMEAARLFRDGWAPEVWLTHGEASPEDEALGQIGFGGLGEHEMSRLVLLKLGVPAESIQVLPDAVADTVGEVRVTSRHAKAGSPVIMVTSKAHTRRVRVTWNAAASSRAAIVRAATLDRFDPGHWWRTTTDVLTVAREVLGIVNARLGFPLSPRTIAVTTP